MTPIVFIASLSHSGSTLLDLLLGAHSRLIGLGELHKVLLMDPARLESEKRMRCTCGQAVADCVFWKPAFDALQNASQATPKEKYALILRIFGDVFGAQQQLVDSSKYLPALRVASAQDTDITVIHLLKDVRSFTVSQRDSLDAEIQYRHLSLLGSPALSRAIYRASIKSPSYLYWKWYLRNRAITNYLEESSIAHTQVGYDELAQRPAEVMALLYAFLGLEQPANAAAIPQGTNSHIWMGNPMIANPDKMRAVQYDDRWVTRNDWRTAEALFPAIRSYNKAAVYSNLSDLRN
jgi:hypothetical protein